MNQVRFIIAGNVDDGKSTLTGRLLYDTGNIKKDILDTLMHHDEKFELAALTDGLKQERENSITIDIAYRYFYSERTKFMLVDAPGHQEFTKNFFTGASNCDAIIILIDSEHGITTQTQKHAQLAILLGIQHWIVAINKMDRCSYVEDKFYSIKNDFEALFKSPSFPQAISFVPISALDGENITLTSTKTNWYSGKPLLNYLQEIEPNAFATQPTRIVVERTNVDNRFLWCRVLSGHIKTQVQLVSVYQKTSILVHQMYQGQHLIDEANAGDCICIQIHEEAILNAGEILVDETSKEVNLLDKWEATLFWMDVTPAKLGHTYILQMNSRQGPIRLESATKKDLLEQNEIEQIEVHAEYLWLIDSFSKSPKSGKGIVIDPVTLETVGAIMNKDK